MDDQRTRPTTQAARASPVPGAERPFAAGAALGEGACQSWPPGPVLLTPLGTDGTMRLSRDPRIGICQSPGRLKPVSPAPPLQPHCPGGTMLFMTSMKALVRRPSPRLAEGLVTHIERRPVDLATALAQWEAYVAAMQANGWETIEVAPAPDCPDSVFVE